MKVLLLKIHLNLLLIHLELKISYKFEIWNYVNLIFTMNFYWCLFLSEKNIIFFQSFEFNSSNEKLKLSIIITR